MASGRQGLVLPFEDLLRFGGRADQVICGAFLATDLHTPAPHRAASEVGRTAFAGLSAVDSSYWLTGGPANFIE